MNDAPERHPHDVLVIGAGGAGLRAAIEAAAAGADVGLVCKSLLGKAHTVMAEGGVAAALGHVDPDDSWQTHFRDTMVGGKMLNNPRMAQLHAQEAPDRVRELEAWGAVFDRTRDGRILQRPFGGHSHPRLAHVGDRTGLEMIRTLQDRAVAAGITVYMECTITHLLTWTDRVTRRVRLLADDRQAVVFPAKAIVLATGGIGRAYEVTSNSWEYSGDGQALAYLAGAELIDMEFVQFHPTGMVWPPGVRGLLVTEAVRGEGGILRNKDGERFMWKYLPEDRRHEYAATDEEAARLGRGARARAETTDARRPPELSTRDNVARAIYTEVREGRGSPHGGVFLDISYLPADHVRRKLPSMYEQFKELADVDITAGPMEVGPDDPLHDGRHPGRRRDGRDDPGRAVRGGRGGGRDARREPARRQLAVGPARVRPADRGRRRRPTRPRRRRGRRSVDPVQIRAAAGASSAAPSRRPAPARTRTGSTRSSRPTMQSLVGIFRTEADLRRGDRPARRACDARWPGDPGRRRPRLQPGLGPRLRAAQHADRVRGDRPERAGSGRESRGAHSRIDFPELDTTWATQNSVVRRAGETMKVTSAPLPAAAGRPRASSIATESTLMPEAHLSVFRGTPETEGEFVEFDVPVEEGMVVLDALHWIQAHEAPDLAVRWNCKAAKCGSCSAEVNGRPSLTCKTRLSDFEPGETITVEPMRAFPLIRDLVTDVSWNYEVNKRIPPFQPAGRPAPGGVALAAGGHRAGPGVPQVHRVLPVPGRLPRPAQPRDRAAVHGPALPRPERRPRDAPDRHRRPARATSRTRAGSATATSRSAAPRSARSTSRSPTTRSSRSRSGSPTSTTTRSRWSGASSAASLPRRCAGAGPERLAPGAARRAVAGTSQRPGRDRPTPTTPAGRRAEPGRPGARSDPLAAADATPVEDGERARPTDRPRPTGADRADRSRRRDRGFAHHPDRRRRPRQPGSGLRRRRPDRRSTGQTPATRWPRRSPRSPSTSASRRTTSRSTPRVVRALGLAGELGAREVDLLLDSKLIVEQLHGRWRVKDAKLIPLRAEARRRWRLPSAGRPSTSRGPRTRPPTRCATRRSTGPLAGGPASVVRRPADAGSPPG